MSHNLKLIDGTGSGEFHKMKVLAGIVMTRFPVSDDSIEEPEVISIGTGTKTITGSHFTASGKSVLDCHGEIIARRGFKRFLVDQIIKFTSGNEQNSIFEILNSKIKLKSDIRNNYTITYLPSTIGAH